MGTIKFKNITEVAEPEETLGKEKELREEVTLSEKREEKAEVLFEDKTMREENVKHFRMSDGSYRAEIYNEPVHYYDETEGRYLTIDNTLCDCPACAEKEGDFDGYENRRGDVHVKFGKSAGSEKLFTLSKGNYGVEWKLLPSACGARSAALQDSEAILPHGKATEATKLSDEIRYNDVMRDTDLQYILTSTKIKENIIVRRRQDCYEYAFKLKLLNLDIELSENGQQLELFTNRIDEESGASSREVMFTIPSPYMYDAENTPSDRVDYELERDGENYIFRIIADKNWIDAEERKFPVTIDPAIVVKPFENYISRTVCEKKDSHGNYVEATSIGRIIVGNNYDNPKARTYLKFRLPSLIGKKIVSAKLSLLQFTCAHEAQADEVNFFEIRKVTSDWSESTKMNWGQHPGFSQQIYACEGYRWGNNIRLNIDITKLAKEWETGPNYGMLLKGMKESTENYNSIYIESRNTTAEVDELPKLSIDYLERRSLSSDEFQTNTVKRSGTHAVDLWTGKNRFIHEDNAFDENRRLSLSISHVYNIQDKDSERIYADRNVYTPMLGAGKGWKLNVQQFVYPVGTTSGYYSDSLKYLYIDQNGDQIMFSAVEKRRPIYSGNTVTRIDTVEEYWDEQGKKLQCIKQDGEILIKDDKGSTLRFRDNELYRIEDKNGDRIFIEKEACGGKISRVYDSCGNHATFFYNSACEISKIDFSDGNTLRYEYDYSNRLKKIRYADDTCTEFYYGENGGSYNLTSVRDQSGYRLNIQYADSKVVGLQDFASNKTISATAVTAYTQADDGVSAYDKAYNGTVYEKAGKKLVIKYTQNTTSVITENGYATNYQFSESGFCNCKYETKNALNASDNQKQVTEIHSFKSFDAFDTMEIRPYGAAENYVRKGTFEGSSDCLAWTSVEGNAYDREYGIATDGMYSLRISGSLTQKRLLRQTIYSSDLNLMRGEGLILSGYAKANSLPPNNQTKFRLYAKIISGTGSRTEELDFDFLNPDWQFAAKGFRIDETASFEKIELYIDYSHNNGVAYFDDIRLTKGDMVYTTGLPRFYTDSDNETYDIDDLVKLKYYDKDHLFGWNADETVETTQKKKAYLDIVAMQQNPDKIILNGEVVDGGAKPEKTMLVFKKGNKAEKTYSLFDVEYAASGVTKIINRSGCVKLYKNKHDDLEKTVLFSNGKDTEKNEEGFETTYEYDSKNRLIKETDFYGVVKEYKYTDTRKYDNVSECKTSCGTLPKHRIIQRFDYYNDRYLQEVYDERNYDENDTRLYTSNNYSSACDYLQSVRLPNGQTTYYSYDAHNTKLLGISTRVVVKSSPGGASQTQTMGIDYSYNLGYLTEISTETGGAKYNYEYDGFGNLQKTQWNGADVLRVNRYADSDYKSADESTYNYEEIELANGYKIKEITDNKGRLLSRKQSRKVNGVYEAEEESYRVVYKKDERGDSRDEIDYTVDKMLAIESGNAEDTSKWEYTEYKYKANGELDLLSYKGARSGYEQTYKDDGGRVYKEAYSFWNLQLDQVYEYEYEKADGEIIPNNRIIGMQIYAEAIREKVKYESDEMGRLQRRSLTGRNGATGSSEYFRETYSYRPSYALDTCNRRYTEGSTNYLSSIQYRCGNEFGTEFVDYDKNGNIAKIQDGSKTIRYSYDGLNRLIEEENQFIGKKYFYSYDGNGNIKEVYGKSYTASDWETREVYGYSGGTLRSVMEYDLKNSTSKVSKSVGNYDEVGNPRSYAGKTLKWTRGRVLSSYGNVKYKYDSENVRREKEENGRTHKYYTSGGRILGEKIVENGTTDYYRYLYEGERVIGFTKNNSESYFYQYGTSGEIVRLCGADGNVLARYAYDAWGNTRIYNAEGLDITNGTEYNKHIGRVNPFRYKGYYYDAETGLYYLQSRYYDPSLRRFINADNIGVVSSDYLTTLGGQNLYSYCLNNPVNTYDPSGHSATVVLGIMWAITKFAFSVGMLALAIYGAIKAWAALIKEPSWLNLLFVVVAMVGVAMSAYSVYKSFRALQAAFKAGSPAAKLVKTEAPKGGNGTDAKTGNVAGDCFIAGTKVLTEDGYKNIEDIEVGDKVLAYDEKTGEQAYKEVVQLFRGETKEWYHVFVDGEEIVCTGNHPFYVEGKGFVKAKDLTTEEKLTLSDGKQVEIEKIEIEKLDKPETKYNFEVEGFHTYYVTEKAVLVHNKCAYDYLDEALKRQGLDKVPEGGFKESWIENGYKIEVRVHSGNPEYTTAKQIFRVSRQPVYSGVGQGAGTSYLATDGIWYHTSVLKPTSVNYNVWAAAHTHIPII